MGELFRKLTQAFQTCNNNPKANLLMVESLESRILLSGDPIYSYADPESVLEWFNGAVAQPNLNSLNWTISAIHEALGGGNLFSSDREKAEINAIKPCVDYLLDHLSYYQFDEWYDVATKIPYYIYNAAYIGEYFQEAVATPMWDYFLPYTNGLSDRYDENLISYVQDNLDSELIAWQHYASNVLPHSLPDFQVTMVQAPTSANEGSYINVSATIYNNSDCDAGAFECQYVLLTADPSSASSAVLWGESFIISGLRGGTSMADSRSFLLPYGEAGSYYIGLSTNIGMLVPEDDISNNFTLAATPLAINPLPDFAAMDVWATMKDSDDKISSARVGDAVQFHTTISRSGLVSMPKAAVSIYASTDLSFDGNDILLDTMNTQQLFTSPEQTVSTWYLNAEPLNELTPGPYYLIAHVDSNNVLDEPNENDNYFVNSTPFIVLNEITPPTAPGTPDLYSSSDSGYSNSDNLTNDVTPTFSWGAASDPGVDASGIFGYQWRVDDRDWSDWQSGRNATAGGLPDGSHVFYVRAQDNAGNTGLEASVEFVIDTISPLVVNVTPLGKLTENFSYLDITFNESIDLAALSIAGIEVDGPGGPVYGDFFQHLTDNSYRVYFPERNTGGEYNVEIGSQVADLAGNSITKPFSGTFIIPTQVAIGNNAAKKVCFYNDSSLVTVQIVNGGATVLFDGTNLSQSIDRDSITILGEDIEIANIDILGNEKTKLTIKSKDRNNQTTLGGITGDSLGALDAKGIDLVGNINLTGILGNMTVDDIFDNVIISTHMGSLRGSTFKANEVDDVDFDIAGTLRNFQVIRFSSGSLVADNIGQVKVKLGDFGADVEAREGDIQGIMTSGDITGDIMADGIIKKVIAKFGSFMGAARAGGEIGTIQAMSLDNALISAGKNIKKVNMKGDILDSYILAGYDIGSDCAFGLQETGGGDLLGSGNIGSVTAKGKFARSYIGAGVLPYTSDTMIALPSGLPFTGSSGSVGKVKFGYIDYLDATENFGLFAAIEIEPFKIGREKAESRDYFLIEPQP